MRCFYSFWRNVPSFETILFKRESRNFLSSVRNSISTSHSNMEGEIVKPPNVLIFTGEDPSQGKTSLADNIITNLKYCLNPDRYVLYLLTPKQALKDPWIESAQLLVVSFENANQEISAIFSQYVQKGGDLLNFCSPFSASSVFSSQSIGLEKAIVKISYKEFSEVDLLSSVITFSPGSKAESLVKDAKSDTVISALKIGSQNIVLSQVHLEADPVILSSSDAEFELLNRSNVNRLGILRDILSTVFELDCSVMQELSLTPCYLLTKDTEIPKEVQDMESKRISTGKGLELSFVDYCQIENVIDVIENDLPVLYNVPDSVSIPFDRKTYFKHLKTKTFGQNLFFSDVVTSTMVIVQGLVDFNGATVIARRQTAGVGRGGNKWISPLGCAMFSTQFSVDLTSTIGKRLSIVQHLVGLATVLAVRKTPGFEDFDLHLKWPNDLYYGRKIKIGGVLVTSTIQGKMAHVFTGCGLNVANTLPTLCLNAAIQFHNSQRETSLDNFSVEQLISRSLTEFEDLLENFQKNGPEEFLKLYYANWLHDGQSVHLAEQKEDVTIVGLDDYGFLLVKTSDGKTVALQPDGNSFDLMKNVITVK